MAWFKFGDDEMVQMHGTLAGGIRRANEFLPGNYDVIIDYFFCYLWRRQWTWVFIKGSSYVTSWARVALLGRSLPI